MRTLFLFLFILIQGMLAIAENSGKSGYVVGDIVSDFSLKNTNGEMISMEGYPEAEGFILIFSCNHCPFVVQSEDRMIDLHYKYAPQGYPVIAINPNDPEIEPRDSYEAMKVRAEEKEFPFDYVVDKTQDVAAAYGATRTPEVYLVRRTEAGLELMYTGSIDDSPRNPAAVEVLFLEDALEAVMNDETPDPVLTRAVGCTIKWRE